MLKFIKHTMDTIGGIEIFPVISFLIFFIFFIALFVWVFRMRKADVKTMAALPLEDDENENPLKR
ncbi:CcoQ/FixQ family Cbb3-type cytochrome c oxidase assembly chaperone [Halocola ammonii]